MSGVYALLSSGRLASSHPEHPASCSTRASSTGRGSGRGGSGAGQGAGAGASEGCQGGGPGGGGGGGLCQELTTAGLQLQSAYWEPIITTKTDRFAGCLDYIWVDPRHFRVTATLDLPFDQPLNWRSAFNDVDFPSIPNAQFPSDHLAMACSLCLLP
ncbi:hypothetical protein V8C86DRAFT_3130935 [Haematococcus lacustris]